MLKTFTQCMPLGLALTLTGISAFADDHDENAAIEEIIVMGERGETSSLDRAMTVTGFNGGMIEALGIQNLNDLEVLVPGLQAGVQSSTGKNEDGHLVMRGVANDRRVNFFQDTSVAVYVDGVYSPTTYGLNGATFDMERIEVSRGPQGTTGGKTSIAGALNYVTKKPTEVWDFKATAEFTDQQSQELSLAFGGPIGDTGFSYRLGVNRLTGDGIIKNVGLGPDAGEPDRLQYIPQLRYTNDRLDITARYNRLEDKGVQRVGLTIGARDTVTQYIRNNDGSLRCEIDREPTSATYNECALDSSGNPTYLINPGYGLGQNPAVANCPGFNDDGTRDAGLPVVCEGDLLSSVIELNAPIGEDNFQESVSVEARYTLNDTHEIVYRYGDRATATDIDNDGDQTNRTGGGVCGSEHPRVISGELSAGQTSPRCALDGQGNGAYNDSISNYIRSSDQQSHEITLVSNNDGPLNYTVGYTVIAGDEPYIYRDTFNGVGTGSSSNNNATFYQDTTAICEAELAGANGQTAMQAGLISGTGVSGWTTGCYGADYVASWSNVSNGGSHVNGSGVSGAFYGDTEYEQKAFYANVEYVLNDQWKLFGGLRYNDDHKEHNQNDFTSAGQRETADGVTYNIVNGIFRGKTVNETCCGYVGINLDADGYPIPDDRTFVDSKVANWTKTTWTLGAEYSASDAVMYYARLSSGYRVGGFSGFGNGLGEAHDPEEMLNYEAGIKGLFLDNAVQLEISAYYQDFSAFWAQASRLKTPAELASSLPGSSAFTGESQAIDGTNIAGIEAQGAWQINDRLVLRGFYEHMYSSFGDFNTSYCCTPQGTTPPGSTAVFTDAEGVSKELDTSGLVNFGGHQLRMQPENKLSATLTYEVPLASEMGSLDLVTLFSWRGEMYPDEGNLDIMAIPAYTRWDLRANWVSASGAYSVTGFVTNALDLVQVQSYSPRDGNGVTAPVNGTVTDARRIGVTFNYQL